MNDPASTSVASDFTFVRRLLIAVAIGALVYTIWRLSDVILLFFGAVLVALMLRSLAAPICAQTGLGERWGLLLAGLLVLGVLSGTALLFGADLSQQLRGLSQRVSETATMLSERLELGSMADLLKGSDPASRLGSVIVGLFAWSSTILSAVASFLLVVFGGIYLAIQPRPYRKGFLALVPPAYQDRANATLDDAHVALGRWLRAQAMAMILVGALTGLGLWLVGLPSVLALALIAGLAEFVPILGPILATLPVVLIASGFGWQTVLLALGVVVVVQQVESNLIAPVLVGATVDVPPAMGLFAIVAMGVLFGPLGLLFGFPLAILTNVAVRRLYIAGTLGQPAEINDREVKAG